MREDEKQSGVHCQYPGCEETSFGQALYRVNPKGRAGIFMCAAHYDMTTAKPR